MMNKREEKYQSYKQLICYNIRTARQKLGLQQKFVAKKLGYSQVYYSSIENGKAKGIDVVMLMELTSILKVGTGNINWFLTKHSFEEKKEVVERIKVDDRGFVCDDEIIEEVKSE